MFLSVAAAVAGWGMAGRPIATPTRATRAHRRKPRRSSTPLLNKYYVDEAYDYVFTGRRKVGDVRLGAMGWAKLVEVRRHTSSMAR